MVNFRTAETRIFKPLLVVGAFVFSVGVQAFQPAKQLQRLLMVSEWDRLCAGYRTTDAALDCKTRVLRATVRGRSLGPFEIVSPLPDNMLQSRSGVLFAESLNRHILGVGEDTGLRTVLRLGNEVRCQAYSAAADLVGTPDADRSYARLIKDWLSVYTDEKSEVESVRILSRDGKPLLRFAAYTTGGRRILGLYLLDAANNASIFSTCDLPMDSSSANLNAEIFFGSIVGSARKFI